MLAANPAAAGAVAWRTDHDGATALVVFNTADHATLLDNLVTGLPPGTMLAPLFAIEGAAPPLSVDEQGRLTLVLPPRAGLAWLAMPSTAATIAPGSSVARSGHPIGIQAAVPAGNTVGLHGTAAGLREVRLVIDGNLASALATPVTQDGTWHATLRTDAMTDPAVTHRVVAYDPAANSASAPAEFKVQLDWQLAADLDDPTDDDTGPAGTYRYPTDPGYASHPADIERVRAWTAGGALRIELTMRSLVASWNPSNGFDHVAFTVFLQLPGHSDGVATMPQQHGALPDAMQWQYRLRAHGWSNALFAFAGATELEEGTPVAPGASLAVDHAARTVTFTLPASALGGPQSLDGARVHVTTWDQDAEYRRLGQRAGEMSFGGGQPGIRW